MSSAQDQKFQSMKSQRDYLIQRRDGAGGITQSMSAFGRDTDEYKKLLKQYKETTKLIDSLEIKIKPLQVAADSVQAGKTAAKEKQKADRAISLKQEELAKARDRNDTVAIERIQEEISGISTPKSNDPNIVGPDINRADDPYGNAARARGLAVVRDPKTGGSYLSSDNAATPGYEGAAQPHYVWFSDKPEFKSKLPGFTSTPNMYIDYSYKNIETQILADAKKSPNGIQILFDRLYKAGLVSKATKDNLRLDSDEFTQGLGEALNSYSKKVQRDYDVNGIKTPISFNQYLDKEYQAVSPEVDYGYKTTLRPTANSDLNRFFMENLGTGASDEQLDEYYKELRALEKKAFIRRTSKKNETGGTTADNAGEFLDGNDKLELQRKIAGKALDGSDIDTILKGGAKAAQDINGVLTYAKNYGISLSNKDALGYVANELKLGQTDMAKVNAKLLAISKATYSNLSDVLSENVSLKDLSFNYRRSMQDILEVDANQLDTMDSTIQTALKNNGNKGAMNLTEFERLLKQDARWGKTKNARETATNFASNILKSFGLVA